MGKKNKINFEKYENLVMGKKNKTNFEKYENLVKSELDKEFDELNNCLKCILEADQHGKINEVKLKTLRIFHAEMFLRVYKLVTSEEKGSFEKLVRLKSDAQILAEKDYDELCPIPEMFKNLK